MKKILIAFSVLTLAGCGRVLDLGATSVSGYSIRCIEGTKYVLVAAEAGGSAVAPLLGTDGLPKGCDK